MRGPDGDGSLRRLGPDADLLELTFRGEVWYWRGPSPYHFVTVPDEPSAAVRALSSVLTYGWGMVPVEVRIGDSVWATSLFPKDGRYIVPIKDVIRRAECLAPGDIVEVVLMLGS